ncbi:sensor histidine kinase [Cohnella sp. GbtcB17]|uniref:sensor histidine kinase n=1 Tax=Cohnella sp. GbtcB17 TaxID=2824762 RepID=UPI001C304C89|nr:sensor histidine kinase [Cohnella sp. GbtcB17]
MRRLIRHFAVNTTIQKKLLLTYIAVVVIPVLLVGLMLTKTLREKALAEAVSESTGNVEDVRKRTSELMRVPIDLSNQALIDQKLRKIVNTRFESTYDVVTAYSEFTAFRDYKRLYREINSVRFYSRNDTLLNNWEFFAENEEVAGLPWYAEALKAQGRIVWRYIPDASRKGQYRLSLIRKITYRDERSYGVLIMGVDPERLRSVFSRVHGDTLLVTDDGYVAAANNEGRIGKSLQELGLRMEPAAGGLRQFETVYEGEPSKVLAERYVPEASTGGLDIVSIVPVHDIVKESNRISRLAFLVILLSLCVAALLIVLFTRLLGKRIRKLNTEIKKVASGNFLAFAAIDGEDEIGQLSRHFHMMVGDLRRSLEEVTAANDQRNALLLKQKETKLRLLASQINPHFLFNTLESIRMKAHVRGDADIARAVLQLGQLMRKSLEIGGELRPLDEEFEMLRHYLSIQQFRYGDRLKYTLEADKRALRCKLYRLLLQPVVENAVIHGLEGQVAGGTVAVMAFTEGHRLVLKVMDDGVGMTRDKLRQVRRELEAVEEEGEFRIGLRNVHQRIRLSYGPGWGVSIESEPGAGTIVTLELPAEEEERDVSAVDRR